MSGLAPYPQVYPHTYPHFVISHVVTIKGVGCYNSAIKIALGILNKFISINN